MKLGSLCTGVGGLDLAVERFFDAELAWCAEIDNDASRVLAARFPGVENIGNFVGRDWSTVKPIDVLCAGYPCQPFSTAGKRLGEQDPRHLWPHVADAVRDLRPRYVVLENVRGHLVLGFPAVLGDLSRLGYDAQWGCVRASDVGAPHRRERLFIVARDTERTPEDAHASRRAPRDAASEPSRCVAADADEPGSQRSQSTQRHDVSARGGGVAADTDGAARPGERRQRVSEAVHEPGTVERSGRRDRVGTAADGGRLTDGTTCESRPGEALQGVRGAHDPQAVQRDTRGHDPVPGTQDVRPELREHEAGPHVGRRVPLARGPHQACSAAWGPFASAVARWAQIIGRCAPSPVDERRRLNPRAVEFMMGFPAGWCTDILDRRTDALRCLGNAVVPQQAMHALSLLVAQPELCATR